MPFQEDIIAEQIPEVTYDSIVLSSADDHTKTSPKNVKLESQLLGDSDLATYNQVPKVVPVSTIYNNLY